MARTPANVKAINEHGPLCPDELPQPPKGTINIKYDIHKFNLSGTSGEASTMGRIVPVYYFRHAHPPELVLRRWLQCNADALRNGTVTKWGLHQRLPGEMKEVWKHIHTEYDFLKGGFPEHIGFEVNNHE